MARAETEGVVGVFRHVDLCARAIEALRASGRGGLRVYSPVPDHRLRDAMGTKKSWIGYGTLVGAITGTTTGFTLALIAATRYHLIVQGKPVMAWIPWVVIGFELTILFGSATNLILSILAGGLLRWKPSPGYDERFSLDMYGVFVPAAGNEKAEARRILETNGAVEVHEHD